MNIPTDASASVQSAFRDVWKTLDGFMEREINFKGRRISNIGMATDNHDAAQLGQVKDLMADPEVTGGGQSGQGNSFEGTVAIDGLLNVQTPGGTQASTIQHTGSATDPGGALRISNGYPKASGVGNYTVFGVWTNSFGEILLRCDDQGFVGIGMAPAHLLQLSADDAAKPTTNTWTIVSDRRVKRKVRPYTDGLAKLRQINPIRYEYNGEFGTPEGQEGIGVIAQDVEEVLPKAVKRFGKGEKEHYGFNSHELTYLLVNAVKEMADKHEENESLRAKVADLERRVTALEGG